MSKFDELLTEKLDEQKNVAELVGRVAMLAGIAPAVSDEYISFLTCYGTSLHIYLSKAGAKSHEAIAQITKVFGEFKKSPSYDGKSITLTAELKDHPTGLETVYIQQYLPESCKLVEYREPISEERKKQLIDELANGALKFKTECKPEQESEEVLVLLRNNSWKSRRS